MCNIQMCIRDRGKSFGILKLDCLPNFDFALPRIETVSYTHLDVYKRQTY